MELPFGCWRCEEPGHTAGECKPPPARTAQELDERITRLVERWQSHEISTPQKAAWIADEIQIFDKGKAKGDGNAMNGNAIGDDE